MAESNSPMNADGKRDDDEELVKKLPSIPSSDEITVCGSLTPNQRQGSIDERLHRLRSVTQGVIAAKKFRRSSSIQGKYVAITPNERDNLEHIQHMTEDITARLDKLRDLDSDAPSVEFKEPASSTQDGELYVPAAVQGKFIEFVPFDASRPSTLGSLNPSDGSDARSQRDISPLPPLPPLPPVDTTAFFNGDVDEMEESEGDAEEGAHVTASLERRLRELSEHRTQ